eukprot:COSAG01_NODE_5435_length_4274_cov_79.781032_3_plen_543_part_00
MLSLLLHMAVSVNIDTSSDDDDAVRYLLLDQQSVVAEVTGASLQLGTIQKSPRNPVVVEDRPWEKEINSGYPNVFFDRDEARYKMWYGCQTYCQHRRRGTTCPHKSYNFSEPTSSQQGRVGGVGAGAQTGSCYAISIDGETWVKPALGAIIFNGSRANNLVMTTAADNGRGFLKDSHDTNASQRYKMFGQILPWCLRNTTSGQCLRDFPNGTGPTKDVIAVSLGTSVSEDGIHWSPNRSISQQVNAAGDSANQLLWDGQQYIGVTRIDLFSAKGQYREAAITTSRDFNTWTTAVEVLQRNRTEGGGAHPRQENSWIIFQPEGTTIWLSLVTFSESPKTTWGKFVTELAYSVDLFTWHRVLPGVPIIPFGPPGSWDTEMILGAAHPFLDPVSSDRVRIYYVGTDGSWKRPRDNSIGLAFLPRDHWAGWAARQCVMPRAPGVRCGSAVIRTHALPARRLQLQLTASIKGNGWLRVVVQGPTATGRLRNVTSLPMTVATEPTDSKTLVDAVVSWATGTYLPSLWQGQRLTLWLLFENATVYSFKI